MTDTEFDTKFDYYETVREELGLSAIWSIYEIDNLSDRHPYEGVKFLTYNDFSGKNITVEINGLTYAALFVAANAVLTRANTHHNFIEAFTPNSKNPEILELHTGS
jgi:hypothetical protein